LGLYNTQYGSEAGDEQYKKIIAQIRSALPENAQIVRVGGDELVIIIDEDSYADLSAEKTLEYISRINSTQIDGLELSITLGGANTNNSSSLLETYTKAFRIMESEKEKHRSKREAGKVIDERIIELTRFIFIYIENRE